ncbi:DUF484 family protein [Luteithermobacter gelatinilyticus]|uniref:DUF484 family protein n=1 Tax=Luteithermobacter gelatinilyticus TaxID=2582913 RepID=UPI00110642B0|nr:DUF484 family protein [Luteithermobacter gelatinilyticus]
MPDGLKHPQDDLTATQIRDWLLRHPDFLTGFLMDHPHLLAQMNWLDNPGETGENVVDFRGAILKRLQQEVQELRQFHGSLITASRNNMSTQLQIHDAVLALLDAEDLAHLSHILTRDWPQILSVDVISLCFEDDGSSPLPSLPELRRLRPGRVNELLGQEDATLLRDNIQPEEDVFGPATGLIRAEALIRLTPTAHTPPGLLAFGSRDADMFTPGQGTELLRFLEAVFRKCLIRWMTQTA